MELADMQVLEACARKGVRVQVPPEPLTPQRQLFMFCFILSILSSL
jgi:hypothetical protein